MGQMPDEIFIIEGQSQYMTDGDIAMAVAHVHKSKAHAFIRAEPVEALLKQARDALVIAHGKYGSCDDLIQAIDSVLNKGEVS